MISINTLFGTTWCHASQKIRQFLDKYGIQYRWVDIDRDEEGEDFDFVTNKGKRGIPIILFDDNFTQANPSFDEFLAKLGINKK